MSELSLKVLAYLRSHSDKKSFTAIDLNIAGFSFQEADQAIDELEECGYIEVNHRFINHSFELI